MFTQIQFPKVNETVRFPKVKVTLKPILIFPLFSKVCMHTVHAYEANLNSHEFEEFKQIKGALCAYFDQRTFKILSQQIT